MINIKKIFLLLLFFPAYPSFASGKSELWLDLSINDYFQKDHPFGYELEAETRFVDEKNYYEVSYFSAGLGYHTSPDLSFWLGYERFTENHISGTAPENHIWEEAVWQIFGNDNTVIRLRPRFEQEKVQGQPEWENRFRQKITAFFPEQLFGIYTPIIYDEIFIKMNNPPWTNSDTFQENRLFLGLAIPTSRISFLEIAYIQQSLFNDTQNEFNNIIYLGFNLNPSGQAIEKYIR